MLVEHLLDNLSSLMTPLSPLTKLLIHLNEPGFINVITA
jgi:hypothetical protein